MTLIITDGFALSSGDLSLDVLKRFGEVVYHDNLPKDKVKTMCAGADILIVNKTFIDAAVIESAKQLKMIALTATGYNNVDLEAASKAGVKVCNVPEYSTYSVAQHAFALIMELSDHVGIHAASVRQGLWASSGKWCYTLKPVVELKDKVLGIVGYGRIGQQLAAMGNAFGMQILYNNRSPKSSPFGIQADMEELFRKSDVISLHCPLTAENKGFVNRELLSLMKPSAVLINTSRGPLINEKDLAQALISKKIAGAGLDVLSEEPPAADNPLTQLDNCIITPHIAWISLEARTRLLECTVSNIEAFLKGAPVNVVNK